MSCARRCLYRNQAAKTSRASRTANIVGAAGFRKTLKRVIRSRKGSAASPFSASHNRRADHAARDGIRDFVVDVKWSTLIAA